MSDSAGDFISGIVVVPFDESAGWWPLTKHFSVVGRRWAGSSVEISRFGKWESALSVRDSVILAFPRAAGEATSPMAWPGSSTAPAVYHRAVEAAEGDDRAYLSALAGSFWYSPARVPHRRGELYMVWSDFDPASEGSVVFDEEEPTVACVEMLLASPEGTSGRADFELDSRGPGAGGAAKGSFSDGNFRPWSVSPGMLFSVSHLVRASQVWDGVSKNAAGRVKWGSVKSLSFSFDWRAADREIARARSAGSVATASSSNMGEELASHGAEASASQAMQDALVSAAEAAAARNRPAPHVLPPPEKAAVAPPKQAERFPCRYAEMKCAGCQGVIGFGKPCRPGGRGLVHDSETCYERAEQTMADILKKSGLGSEPLAVGSARREAVASHRLSDERKRRIMLCLDGKCGVAHGERLMCKLGCGRGLHAFECGAFSKGVRDLGNLECAYCRGQKLLVDASAPLPSSVVSAAIGTMIIELTSGSSNTFSGYSDLVTLERRWQASVGGDSIPASQVRLPHTSQDSALAFIEWCASEGGRARSLGSVVIMLSSYCSKLEINDVTSGKRVVRLLKDLQDKGQACTAPCTAITPALNALMIRETIGEVCRR